MSKPFGAMTFPVRYTAPATFLTYLDKSLISFLWTMDGFGFKVNVLQLQIETMQVL